MGAMWGYPRPIHIENIKEVMEIYLRIGLTTISSIF
jgi:hypothetical protein